MRILAVDTASPGFSVAVLDEDRLLSESSLGAGPSHGRHVMVMIRKALEWSGLTVGDLDGFAVSRGPGSFTGLRIGASTIKGLSAASGKPMVGISSLAALALQAPTGSSWVCPMMDARKGEVYFSLYRADHRGRLKRIRNEKVQGPSDAVDRIDQPCMFIGPGALLYRDTIAEIMGVRALFAPASHCAIRASTLAWLARLRLENGDVDDVENFVPVYIRRSDAERQDQ